MVALAVTVASVLPAVSSTDARTVASIGTYETRFACDKRLNKPIPWDDCKHATKYQAAFKSSTLRRLVSLPSKYHWLREVNRLTGGESKDKKAFHRNYPIRISVKILGQYI